MIYLVKQDTANFFCNCKVHLQHIPPTIIAAFEELSMQQVLDRAVTEPMTGPTKRQVLNLIDASPRQQKARLLRAHELLAELCEQSRGKFRSLIDTLKSDCEAGA